jgi:small subunit ribosomal protein S6
MRSDALAQNVYEGLFILDPNRYGHDPDGISGQITALIEKFGGEILVSRLWEERRLAYPVKGQRKGTYWLIYFKLDSYQLLEVKKQCQINDNLLRVLFLKVDPRIVDALVEHARTAPVVTLSDEAETAAPPTDKVLASVELDPDELNVSIDAVEEE